jgi:uncharacterized protein (UPF0261 family)
MTGGTNTHSQSKAKVLLISTLDTKPTETQYLRSCLEEAGVQVIHMDPSIRRIVPGAEIGPEAIAAAAVTTIQAVRDLKHEGKCQAEMLRGAIKLALALHAREGLSGILCLGGSMGTGLGTTVMREFPYGLPKVMISTMASGFTTPFVGTRDIIMVNSVCDISGLNTLSRDIYRNAAIATAAMARDYSPSKPAGKPLVLITTLGTTEKSAARVRTELEAQGFEVMVFHSSGTGGATLDQLVRERPVSAVVDLSLVEIIDRFYGGLLAGLPDRASAAIDAGVPLILVPGNCDFIVGGPLEQARKQYPGRQMHAHNPQLTAIRTYKDEYVLLANELGEKLKIAKGSVTVYMPMGGLSSHDSPEGHLYDLRQTPVLAAELRRAIPAAIPVIERPEHINDAAFADLLVARVLEITGHRKNA